jgi:Zn-dependent M28 family amino/carboxypeptidase
MEDDPALRRRPNDGANDGASGNAVMLELARVFSAKRPEIGIDLLFTDGEDYGPGINMMFLGAKHFADQLSDTQLNSYNYGILLDMVGDRNQDFHPEYNSEGAAPKLYGVAMGINKALGYRSFKEQGAYDVLDDHIPLIERGMKIYDFIDFNYEPWNKTTDRIDKCAPASLESIGRTIENMVYLFPAIYGEAPK